ncbi:Uncharacterised protein [Pantoea agglomerans]|uniref:Uncharacterized protein n=1 Tax=Enterobacter agglomerans TaxID=549 RepID=A0A379AMS1_ENTAG|nr:Uncharacterised protein [Pantoea agglomerans]
MTAGACTTGTANTVNVIFTVVWQIVVKDVGNSRDVQTASSHVSGDQNIHITFGEVIQNAQALLLSNVAGQQADTMSIGSQVAPDIFTAVLGVGENNGAIGPLFFQQGLQQGAFSLR